MNIASGFAFCIALLIASCGCQRATQRIDREQSRIASLAHLTIDELARSNNEIDAAVATGEIGFAAQVHIDQALAYQRLAFANQQKIAAAAGRTRSQLTRVEDKAHPLVRLAQTWSIVALIAGVIALLGYLGIGPLIRRAFQMIGLLIPKAVRTDAKFDVESIVGGIAGPAERERIAARRAADSVYDRAFSLEKARNRLVREL